MGRTGISRGGVRLKKNSDAARKVIPTILIKSINYAIIKPKQYAPGTNKDVISPKESDLRRDALYSQIMQTVSA